MFCFEQILINLPETFLNLPETFLQRIKSFDHKHWNIENELWFIDISLRTVYIYSLLSKFSKLQKKIVQKYMSAI